MCCLSALQLKGLSHLKMSLLLALRRNVFETSMTLFLPPRATLIHHLNIDVKGLSCKSRRSFTKSVAFSVHLAIARLISNIASIVAATTFQDLAMPQPPERASLPSRIFPLFRMRSEQKSKRKETFSSQTKPRWK
jgi:hypothetical protein